MIDNITDLVGSFRDEPDVHHVIHRHGQPVAVLLSYLEYEALLADLSRPVDNAQDPA